jgi:hypothetical protein
MKASDLKAFLIAAAIHSRVILIGRVGPSTMNNEPAGSAAAGRIGVINGSQYPGMAFYEGI